MARPYYSAEALERSLEYSRKWAREHPEYKKEKYASLTPEQKARYRERQTAYYAANLDKRRAASRANTLKRKLAVIAAYGGKCTCCGETQHQFLTINRINVGGAKHVKSICKARGHDFYRWLEKQSYPQEEYQLLCWNCNAAKGIMSGCPHGQHGMEYGLSGC